MAFPLDPGRPPGRIQPLENLVPNQGNVDPRAMLPLAPAREQQHHDVRQHAGLGHGQHDDQEMNLEDMLPLRQAFNLNQDDDMLEDGNNQLREQVMSPREHGQQQRVNAVQDRPQAFAPGPANVVAEHQRHENREYHDGGNIFLQQRNILQQVIQQFQQPPQLEMILETQRDVMHQLVQEAHRVRQEVKDIKNAMVHALQTVDTNHASHDQIIQAQAQYLQRLTAKQDALTNAMQALSDANVRLNESMLAQERESETRKARLEVLEKFIGEKLNDTMLRVPAETQNLHQRLTKLEELSSQSQMGERTVASMVDNHQEWQSQVETKLTDLITDQQLKEIKTTELLEAHSRESHSRNERLEDKLKRLELQVEEQRRQIVQLEVIPRMTKAELNTPEKDVDRRLFHETGQSSQSHSQKDPPGESSIPPNSHSQK